MSDVLKALSVLDWETVGGLVTPLRVMVTAWPLGTVWPPLRFQVRVVLLLPLQFPTWVLLVVSVTIELTIVLRTVLAGKLIVIWLFAVAERPPVPVVVNPIV